LVVIHYTKSAPGTSRGAKKNNKRGKVMFYTNENTEEDTTAKRQKEICTHLAHLMQDENFVVLDTETTGLSGTDEICEIAIVDARKKVLIDQIIRPTIKISEGAARVHGISDAEVKNAPYFCDVINKIYDLINEKMIFIYNADFDIRLMMQSCRAHNIDFAYNANSVFCVMKAFAEWNGDWNDYYGNYRWYKLNEAAKICKIVGNGFHRARSDVSYTLEIMRYLRSLA
jgi:DNA polymerase III subunit epsilon